MSIISQWKLFLKIKSIFFYNKRLQKQSWRQVTDREKENIQNRFYKGLISLVYKNDLPSVKESQTQ